MCWEMGMLEPRELKLGDVQKAAALTDAFSSSPLRVVSHIDIDAAYASMEMVRLGEQITEVFVGCLCSLLSASAAVYEPPLTVTLEQAWTPQFPWPCSSGMDSYALPSPTLIPTDLSTTTDRRQLRRASLRNHSP